MNIQPAWKKGYTGKGVVVSILDDGIQPNHPDLSFNYVSLLILSSLLYSHMHTNIFTRLSYIF